jgi:putative glutamine amidotransferase
MNIRPVVLVPMDFDQHARLPFHCLQDKYVTALRDGAGCVPVAVPGFASVAAPTVDFDCLLELADGVFLPGGRSNVHPSRYGAAVEGDLLFDATRDSLSLSLVQAAIGRGLPLLGVCRGMQELNVAMSGSLHQRVQLVDGMLDHREPDVKDVVQRFGKAHEIAVKRGGLLSDLGFGPMLSVNSLHQQGIRALAQGLRVEATAADGLIEAVSATSGDFVLGVQWHPEWRFFEDDVSIKIFEAFGAACRKFAVRKLDLSRSRKSGVIGKMG